MKWELPEAGAMISLNLVYWILFTHVVADMVIRPFWVQNKWYCLKALTGHCAIYAAIVLVLTLNPLYALINGIGHFAVDWVTGGMYRISAKDTETAIAILVIDQICHMVILLETARYLL